MELSGENEELTSDQEPAPDAVSADNEALSNNVTPKKVIRKTNRKKQITDGDSMEPDISVSVFCFLMLNSYFFV